MEQVGRVEQRYKPRLNETIRAIRSTDALKVEHHTVTNLNRTVSLRRARCMS